MAITSFGYDGTITETQWAKLGSVIGTDHCVIGANDMKVTIVAGGNLQVAVAAGTAYGYGVMDTSDAQVSVQLGAIASGTRWDLVALRRNWSGVGGSTTVVSVAGSSAAAMPGGRNATPGTLCDQPLALVQVTAGQTTPTQIIDLLVWSSKVLTTGSSLALPEATTGAEAIISGSRYRKAADGSWQNAEQQRISPLTWAWGSTNYGWQVPGTLQAPPGSITTVPCLTNHIYQFTSQFTLAGQGAGAQGTVHAMLVGPFQTMKTARVFVQYGSCEASVHLTGFVLINSPGVYQINTLLQVVNGGAIAVVDNPTSDWVDLGQMNWDGTVR